MHRLIIVFIVLLTAASAYSQFRSDSCGCPIPAGDHSDSGSFGRHIPHFADIQPHRSPDGRFMGYVTNGGQSMIMDLRDHSTREIVVQPRHEGEKQDYIYPAVWCPYDPDMVLVTVRSRVDTSHTGMNPVPVFNIFTYRISTGASHCITPDTLGPYGALSKGALTFGASYWLAGSRPGRDSLLVGISPLVAPDHKQFWGLYLPQKQLLIRLSDHIPDSESIAVSPDSTHIVWLSHNPRTGQTILPIHFDTIALEFNVPLDTTSGNVQSASFSPNGSLIAYWVFPQGNGDPGDTIFDQVWICPVSNPTKIERVINFQCLYCTYSFWGIYPEFISDSTLAVSMHHDGDSVSALWEIGLDGHIVRQLTHTTAAVKRLDNPMGSQIPYPNPARDMLTINLTQAGMVTLIDELGRTIMIERHPSGSSTLDVLNLPSGAYVLRTPDGDSHIVLE